MKLGAVSYTHLDVYKRQQSVLGTNDNNIGMRLGVRARVLMSIISNSKSLPEVPTT